MTEPSAPRDTIRASGRRWHYLLLLVPFAWQVGMLPVANAVRWSFAGIPFPMLWQMAGIVVATIAIGLTFHVDRKRADASTAGEAPR